MRSANVENRFDSFLALRSLSNRAQEGTLTVVDCGNNRYPIATSGNPAELH